jgi:hypothetical protein
MTLAMVLPYSTQSKPGVVRWFVGHLPLWIVSIVAGSTLFIVQPLSAHSNHGETLVSAAALDGLVADEALCGPGGYRIAETDLCTHGPNGAPQGDSAVVPSNANLARLTPVVCEGNGVSGKRVQVLYVRTESAPDRYSEYLASFRAWAAEADAIYNESAQVTGGERRIRFVTDSACEIDIPVVVLPDGSERSFASTVSAMRALGYNRPTRKYLLFMEASVYCGVASIVNDHRPGPENRSNHIAGYARVDNGCWEGVTVAHELTHTLGGVQHTAPNATGGWHCTDGNDIMCYSDVPYYPAVHVACPATRNSRLLDCNNDDYFHTNPPAGSYLASHWNVADSHFLIAGPALPIRPDLALLTSDGSKEVTLSSQVELVIDVPATTAAEGAANNVQGVEFYLNETSLATVSNGPYRYTWQATTAGEHTFGARIYWADGATITLDPLVVRVTPGAQLDSVPNEEGQHIVLLPLVVN